MRVKNEFRAVLDRLFSKIGVATIKIAEKGFLIHIILNIVPNLYKTHTNRVSSSPILLGNVL
jgi:hypothetical protein